MENMKQESKNSSTKNIKFKGVWAISETTGNGKPMWKRMGTAFVNRDNSINVYLEAIPKNFKLHIRDLDPEKFQNKNRKANG